MAAVIGTGMMGPGIAVTLALGGVRPVLVSRTEGGAARGLEAALARLRVLEENGLAPAGQAADVRQSLAASADLDAAAAGADIVVESGPESMEFKQELFARLDSITRPEAVLASNTSGLSITAIASRCARPERILTTHFWNPPHLMPLVEVVKGERTSEEVASAVRGLLGRCGKVPVLVRKDRPGQLGNRLQMALVREAIHILEEGIAGAEEIDVAARCGFGLRLPVYGILEHQDIVGLDLGMAVLDYVSRDLSNWAGIPPLARRLMSEGRLGVAAGEGFYDWTVKDDGEVKAVRDRFLLEFLKNNPRPCA